MPTTLRIKKIKTAKNKVFPSKDPIILLVIPVIVKQIENIHSYFFGDLNFMMFYFSTH